MIIPKRILNWCSSTWASLLVDLWCPPSGSQHQLLQSFNPSLLYLKKKLSIFFFPTIIIINKAYVRETEEGKDAILSWENKTIDKWDLAGTKPKPTLVIAPLSLSLSLTWVSSLYLELCNLQMHLSHHIERCHPSPSKDVDWLIRLAVAFSYPPSFLSHCLCAVSFVFVTFYATI